MTMEALYANKKGKILATGPLEYKVPCVQNIPREFNVKLLQNTEKVNAVYSSKVL